MITRENLKVALVLLVHPVSARSMVDFWLCRYAVITSIVGDSLIIVLGQQITPVGIAVGVVYGINGRAEGSGGVGVFLVA